MSNENFSSAIQITDKFHVVKHIVEAVQSLRLRLKQQEQSALPASAKERKKKEKRKKKMKLVFPTEKLALKCSPEAVIYFSK